MLDRRPTKQLRLGGAQLHLEWNFAPALVPVEVPAAVPLPEPYKLLGL